MDQIVPVYAKDSMFGTCSVPTTHSMVADTKGTKGNDPIQLTQFILVNIHNYADDNTLSWSKNNNMKVNPDKFQCIVFDKKKPLIVLK